MIDLIKFSKKNISFNELATLISRNSLSKISENGKSRYSNKNIKNLKISQGVYIDIDSKDTLRIEGSLHKYYNEVHQKERQNYNQFSMIQAKESFDILCKAKGVITSSLKLKYYEVGINLELPQDCSVYLNAMKYIYTKSGTNKKFYVNPRYKDERVITTEFHKDVRVHFKAYDKVFEIRSKSKNNKEYNVYLSDKNILRVETVNKRVDSINTCSFFSNAGLKRLYQTFFKEWESIEFEPIIKLPKQAHRSKHQIVSKIILIGKENTLKESSEEFRNGTITAKQYRLIKEFINNEWDKYKPLLIIKQSKAEKEFKQALKKAKELYYSNL